MPVIPTDIQVAFSAGAFLVDMGREYIEAEHKASPERSQLAYCRFRNWAALYAALCLAPVIAIFFSAWPAWETQYWTVHAEQLLDNGAYAFFAGLFVLLLVGAGFFGNWLAFRLVTQGRGKLVRPIYLSVLAVTTGIYLIQWPAPVKLGSVSQFRADPYSLPYIWQNTEFFVMFTVLLAYCAIPLIVMFFRLRRKNI